MDLPAERDWENFELSGGFKIDSREVAEPEYVERVLRLYNPLAYERWHDLQRRAAGAEHAWIRKAMLDDARYWAYSTETDPESVEAQREIVDEQEREYTRLRTLLAVRSRYADDAELVELLDRAHQFSMWREDPVNA